MDEYSVLKKVIDKWGTELSKLEKKGDVSEDATKIQFILQTASILPIPLLPVIYNFN